MSKKEFGSDPFGEQGIDAFGADDMAMPAGGIDLSDSALSDRFKAMKSKGARKGVAQNKPTEHGAHTSNGNPKTTNEKEAPKTAAASEPAKKTAPKRDYAPTQIQVREPSPAALKEDGLTQSKATQSSDAKTAKSKTAQSPQQGEAVTTAPANPIAPKPNGSNTGMSKLGSIKPTSQIKSYVENGHSISADDMRVNFGVHGKPKNPLAADKSLMTKPVQTSGGLGGVKRTLDDAIKAVHAVGGAFNLDDVRIFPQAEERDVHARIGTESGMAVETDGKSFDLFAPQDKIDASDISLDMEVRSMLEAAKEMGWKEIDIDGTPEFCEAAKRLSKGMGVAVIASIVYEPAAQLKTDNNPEPPAKASEQKNTSEPDLEKYTSVSRDNVAEFPVNR